MATPASTASGAVSFQSLTDKLAAIIYLLNTTNMTAAQIQTGSVPFQNITDKTSAIIYLLSANSGGGGVTTGTSNPTSTGTTGAMYLNTTDNTLWVYNGTWRNLV